MSRLTDALNRRNERPSGLLEGIESALRGHFQGDIAETVQRHSSELAARLMAAQEKDREETKRAIQSAMEQVASTVLSQMEARISQIKIPEPKNITQVIEKPIERVVERVIETAQKSEPLTTMKVKRNAEGYISQLNTNKGSYTVLRDERGMITGVKRA